MNDMPLWSFFYEVNYNATSDGCLNFFIYLYQAPFLWHHLPASVWEIDTPSMFKSRHKMKLNWIEYMIALMTYFCCIQFRSKCYTAPLLRAISNWKATKEGTLFCIVFQGIAKNRNGREWRKHMQTLSVDKKCISLFSGLLSQWF